MVHAGVEEGFLAWRNVPGRPRHALQLPAVETEAWSWAAGYLTELVGGVCDCCIGWLILRGEDLAIVLGPALSGGWLDGCRKQAWVSKALSLSQ